MEELVKIEGNGNGTYLAVVGENENFLNINGAEEELGLQPIFYRIQQKKKGELEAGHFTVFGGNQVDELEFVLLAMSHSRAWFPAFDPANPEQEPNCKSDDGILPNGGTQMQKTACKDCQHAKWRGKKKAPACSQIFNLLCYDSKEKMPFMMRIKRTGISSLRRLLTEIKARGISHLMANVKATLTKVEEPSIHYVPTFCVLGKLTQEELEHMKVCAKNFIDAMKSIRVEEGEIEQEQEQGQQQQEAQVPVNNNEKPTPNDQIVMGKVSGSPDLRTTPGGKSVCTFTLIKADRTAIVVQCWENVAINASSLISNDDVQATGYEKEQTWVDQQGNSRSRKIFVAKSVSIPAPEIDQDEIPF